MEFKARKKGIFVPEDISKRIYLRYLFLLELSYSQGNERGCRYI